MRLNNEGKPTSKLWLVGGAVGAVAIAAAASMMAGTPKNTAQTGAPNAAQKAGAATETHSEDDGHGHSPDDGHGHGPDDGHGHEGDAAANATNTAPSATATGTPSPATTPAAGKTTVKPASTGKVTTIEGIKVEDLRVGTGKAAKSGDSLTMDYRGFLTNGSVFDESYKRGQPFTFNLGAGDVIQGWDKGVVGMKEGGKRRLTIPSELAYGANSPSPDIPPNSTLIFEIELRKVG
jgi:FKBP-type peptidyl-prolyl cis-trans isomerase